MPTFALYRDYRKYITDNNMSLSSIIKIRECLNSEYFDVYFDIVMQLYECKILQNLISKISFLFSLSFGQF